MSTNTPARNRLERYALLASIPTVGIAGTSALAGDIYHYGGPAIVIDRGNFSSGTKASGDHFWSQSNGATTIPDSPIQAFNRRNYENFGQGKSSWNIIQAGLTASIEGIAFGATSVDNFGRLLAEGHEINGDNSLFLEGEMRIASTQDISSAYNQGITRNGDWALVEGDEVRGFLAFSSTEDGEEFGYGWMDIGWDGEVLTIYDYAVSDGSIEAGQTSSSTVVPGAGGLAALAMGAAGLRRRRKLSA